MSASTRQFGSRPPSDASRWAAGDSEHIRPRFRPTSASRGITGAIPERLGYSAIAEVVTYGCLALIIQASHTPRHVMPLQPEYWKKPPFTRQVNLYTGPGWETPIAVLPGQGTSMVYSTHFPNPRP